MSPKKQPAVDNLTCPDDRVPPLILIGDWGRANVPRILRKGAGNPGFRFILGVSRSGRGGVLVLASLLNESRTRGSHGQRNQWPRGLVDPALGGRDLF